MKKLIAYILAVAAIAAAAFAADPLVLSTSSSNSGAVTTTVTVGRIQADPASDGSITLTVIPNKLVALADGTVISNGFTQDWLTVKLSPTTVAAIASEIAAAKAAKDAADLAAKAPAPSGTSNP